MNFAKSILLAGACLLCAPAHAGSGWYIRFVNNMTQSQTPYGVSGAGGAGNDCWYSYDLDHATVVPPGEERTIYTEEQWTYIACSDTTHYQSFVLWSFAGTKDILVMLKAEGHDPGGQRSITVTRGAEQVVKKWVSPHDTVYATIEVNGTRPEDIRITELRW